MRRSILQNVVGHGDWEAQNLRWLTGRPFVIYDWDSVVCLPEAAIIGAAAGAFASSDTPTLASLESSEAFLDAYQSRREHRFTPEEIQVAWAASLWPAIHTRAPSSDSTSSRSPAKRSRTRLRHASNSPRLSNHRQLRRNGVAGGGRPSAADDK
jgi:hypothetical protein